MKNQKNRIQKDVVFIAISMFVIATMWVGFNLYNAHVTSTIDETLQITIQPIVGKFDTDTIKKLQQRPVVKPDYETPTASFSAPTPTLQQAPIASESSPLEEIEIIPEEEVNEPIALE